MTTKPINVVNVVARSIINITQDITQGTLNEQIVSVDCTSGKDVCQQCLGMYIDLYNLDPLTDTSDRMRRIKDDECAFACQCSVENVNLTQIIKLDFKTNLKASNLENFKKQLWNELYVSAKQSMVGFQPSSASTTSVNKSITNLYTKLQTDEMQIALASIKTAQTVSFKGPGLITNVSMDMCVDYVAQALLTNDSITSDISDIKNEIMVMSSEVIKSGLGTLITIMIQLFAVVVGIIALLFLINRVVNLYVLIVS